MEGSIYIPFTTAALVNIPPSSNPVTQTLTLFVSSVDGRLSAKRNDGTIMVFSAGATPVTGA